MKKFLLPLLSIILFTACQKEISTTKVQEEIASVAANKQTKITVCHYDAVTGTSKAIQVDQSALAGHLAHGDLQGECSAVQTTICDQVWMVKNLDVTTYKNGDVIPEVTNPTAWASLTIGAWCYYENNSTNGTTYGKLYNWYAVNDPRGLAPTGWHIPTDVEWTTLITCLGGDAIAGGKMKSVGTIEAGTGLWYDPNTDATNSSGFTALPGGGRSPFGEFASIGIGGTGWSSTEANISHAWLCQLASYNAISQMGNGDKLFGFSVRLLKD